MPTIELRNVSKCYGEVRALHQINLTIREGEFLVLLGPSGAGKTTTLKLIAGIERPTSGSILFNGKDVGDTPPGERDIAMVFESYALYPHMSVRDNMINPLRSKRAGLSMEQAEERVRHVAKMLRMEKFLDRMPSQLSGGQKQRVAMGRAMVREASVFLLDEPLSHVDARVREQLRLELRRLRNTIKSTVVYVTHDYIEALSLGTRIAVINKGKIEQIGTPYEVYYRPANTFVASLIGQPEMNLFAAKARETGDRVAIEFTEVQVHYELPRERLRGLAHLPEDLLVGIRPQHIRFDREPRLPRGFQAKIAILEDLKSELILVACREKKEFNILSQPGIDLREGQDIYVEFPEERLLFFSSEGRLLSPGLYPSLGEQ